MAPRQVRGHLSSRSKHVDTARSAPTANESYKPWTKTKLCPQAPVDIQLHIPHVSQEKALWTVMQVGAWDICSEEWEVFKAPRGNRHTPHSCKQWCDYRHLLKTVGATRQWDHILTSWNDSCGLQSPESTIASFWDEGKLGMRESLANVLPLMKNTEGSPWEGSFSVGISKLKK